MQRLVVAFLFAPLFGLLAGDALCWLIFRETFGLGTLFGALIAYPLVIVVGIPVFLSLRFLRLLKIGPVLGTGMLIAVAGWAAILWPLHGAYFEANGAGYALFGLTSGLVGSLLFWHLGEFRDEARPNEA